MKRQRPLLERGVEALAGLSLSGAAAFATFSLAPLAALLLAGAAVFAGIAAAAAGFALFRMVEGDGRNEGYAFEPVDFVEPASADEDALEDELLLDDLVAPVEADSRVIRLFGPQPLPEPGELVTRIADYLGSGRASRPADEEPVRNDASAALHAALADIRRSLG